jgi:hypothetical protein
MPLFAHAMPSASTSFEQSLKRDGWTCPVTKHFHESAGAANFSLEAIPDILQACHILPFSLDDFDGRNREEVH